MNDFEAMRQSYYHCVAVGPFEAPTHTLIGSDIVLHLPVLQYYASRCEHVTELGVREGHSTVALLSGCRGIVHSYDICRSPIVDALKGMELPCKWEFHQGDTADGSLQMEMTDFLFIDTLHTYDHVKKELALWGNRAGGYIGFHDTFTCGLRDISGPNPNARGIIDAIHEFIDETPNRWQTVYKTDVNNGLWIIGRE